ncbi:MAG: nucleotidyltransferase family protein [Clostridia bacterium]|nr:nucleotidyltransferase family protein [Clostridia bacterium]
MKVANEVKILIELIKSVLNEDFTKKISEEICFDNFYSVSKAHGLSGFVACCPEAMQQMPKEIQNKFRYEFNISVAKETAQDLTVSKFLDKMEEAGIRCLPLKGFYIKNKYPTPALRQMTDTDILIAADKIEKIIPIMESLGMKYDHDTLHEAIFKSSQLVIELHKELVPSSLGKLYEYYKDGWNRAVLCSGKKFVYEMSPEDTYIFVVTHIAKHYVNGGIGIKHVADIFVMSKEVLDEEYINAELSKLCLEKFHSTLKNVADMWFSTQKKDSYADETLAMANFILGSGEFGNVENRISAGFRRTEAGKVTLWTKTKKLLRRVFPALGTMKLLYPAVNRCGALYPIYAVIRIFDILFNRKKQIRTALMMANAKQETVDSFAEHCSRMGLPKDL